MPAPIQSSRPSAVWLTPGLAACIPSVMESLELQIQSHPSPFSHSSHPLAADGEDDPYDRFVSRQAEKRVGLRVYQDQGFAIQPVSGVLIHGARVAWEAYHNVMNTARIAQAAATVAANPKLHALILDFNTPGGYVTGVAEAAGALQALPSIRKDCAVVGYVSGMACSAGSWIAAGCQVIKAAPSATLGSIGVYNYLVDTHRMYEDFGVDVYLATDGKYKAMGMAGVKVPDEHKALLKDGVMETSAEFKGYMRSRRKGLSGDTMQGQTFTAKKAPSGLHDGTEFATLEELLAALLD